MSEVIDFVQARLNDNELAAKKAHDGPWHMGGAVDQTRPCNVHTFPGSRHVAGGLSWQDAQHIVMHDPIDALLEVLTTRLILKLHTGGHECSTYTWYEGTAEIDRWTWVMDTEDCSTVLLLAERFSRHVDFRQEWRVRR